MTAFSLTHETFARNFQPRTPVNFHFPGDTGLMHVVPARVDSTHPGNLCTIAYLHAGSIRQRLVRADVLSVRRYWAPEIDNED